MNRKKVAGIDYSLTSPAICIYSEEQDGGHFDFDRSIIYYLAHSQKQQQLAAGSGVVNLRAEPYPEYDTEEERHDKLSSWVVGLVQGCEEVFLEGYAYATVGKSHVRSIAENTGLLKHKLWKLKMKVTSIPPTVIKKYATGKGSANKELMYESFTSELLTPPDLPKILTPKSKKIISPISDIVDSYYICKYGLEGFIT